MQGAKSPLISGIGGRTRYAARRIPRGAQLGSAIPVLTRGLGYVSFHTGTPRGHSLLISACFAGTKGPLACSLGDQHGLCLAWIHVEQGQLRPGACQVDSHRLSSNHVLGACRELHSTHDFSAPESTSRGSPQPPWSYDDTALVPPHVHVVHHNITWWECHKVKWYILEAGLLFCRLEVSNSSPGLGSNWLDRYSSL